MKDNFDLSPLKKTKRKNSRNKGNTFENSVAKQLNKHFGTDEFSRTPGSGAFATTHNLPKELRVFGDLITPKNFKYYIECKKGYNNINLYSFFNYSSDLWGILIKLKEESKYYNKKPLLIFKQDRRDCLVFTTDVALRLYITPSLNILNEWDVYLFKDMLDTIPKEAFFM